MQFWIDGEYKLYYYDIVQGKYVAGQTLGTPTGSTIEAKNDYFKAQRRTAFKASAENYWDIQDALYHFDFLIITGATDNFAKNTYPYKMKTLAHGGRYKWRQDDLDSLWDIDNSGADTKPYYIEFKDAEGGSPFFAGSASIFWNLIFECYWDDYTSTVSGNVESGLLSMGRSILEAMRDLSGASNTYDGFVNYIGQCFWDKAQNYFPQSAYSVDANFKYEQAWLNNGQNVDPLSQALGNHFSAEKLWVKRRAVYMLSLFHAGPFGDYSDTSLGTISFRPQGISTSLVPAVWLYPALGVGQGMLNGSRTEPGEPQAFSTTGDGNTTFYIQASNYLSSLGDLKNLVLGSQYVNPINVQGRKLTSFKIGDASASVTTNVPGLTFPNNKCLETIDARNASSIRGSLDLSNCTRLRSVLLTGTSVTDVNIPRGSKISLLALSSATQRITMVDLKHLPSSAFFIENAANVESLWVENNLFSAPDALVQVHSESNALSYIRVIWADNYVDNNRSVFDAIVSIAESDCAGIDADGGIIAKPFIEGQIDISESGMIEIPSALIVSSDVPYGDNLREMWISNFNTTFGIIYNPDNVFPAGFSDDGRVWAKAVITSDGTYRVSNAGPNSTYGWTALEIDGSVVTASRDQTLTAGEHLLKFTLVNTSGIDGNLFRSTSIYTEIYLPVTVSIIGDYSFYGTTGDVSLKMDKKRITSINQAAFYQARVIFGDIDFPNLQSLGSSAFQAFYGAAGYKVTNLGVITSIPSGCFREIPVTDITLPATITSIGDYAFYINNYNIEYTILAPIPPTLGTGSIMRTPKSIKVPAGSVDAYKTATGWTAYANVISAISE